MQPEEVALIQGFPGKSLSLFAAAIAVVGAILILADKLSFLRRLSGDPSAEPTPRNSTFASPPPPSLASSLPLCSTSPHCYSDASETIGFLRVDDFAYDLPAERIAQTPMEPRDRSRLLVVHRDTGKLEHRHFDDIPTYLRSGDVLVANESRVIPARLYAHKRSGGRVELLLLHAREDGLWEAMVSPGRGVIAGARLALETREPDVDGAPLDVEIVEVTPTGNRVVRFGAPLERVLESAGHIPLPPYIRAPLADPERYQTVYAAREGSVAAPTAGLHFTPELMCRLREQGVEFEFLLLHVGPGTFRPVKVDDVESHQMDAEYGIVTAEAAGRLNRAKAEGRRIICVGTTSVRLLETAGQSGRVEPFDGWTRMFIYPGYTFRMVDALTTNFHLPRSTLLMLTSALGGTELIRRAYETAVREKYRFYSFGDAMLIV